MAAWTVRRGRTPLRVPLPPAIHAAKGVATSSRQRVVRAARRSVRPSAAKSMVGQFTCGLPLGELRGELQED